MIKLVEEMKGRALRVVGVSVNHREDDRLAAMEEHTSRIGYNFSNIFDESQQIESKLVATRTPEHFVFDQNRKLAYIGLLIDSPATIHKNKSLHYTHQGSPRQYYVKDAIETLLAAKTVGNTKLCTHGHLVVYEKVGN